MVHHQFWCFFASLDPTFSLVRTTLNTNFLLDMLLLAATQLPLAHWPKNPGAGCLVQVHGMEEGFNHPT